MKSFTNNRMLWRVCALGLVLCWMSVIPYAQATPHASTNQTPPAHESNSSQPHAPTDVTTHEEPSPSDGVVSQPLAIDPTNLTPGWHLQDNSWIYVTEERTLAKDAWVWHGQHWYYLDKQGRMASNTFVTTGGHTYWVQDDGAMQTGWLKLQDRWYFAKDNGSFATTEWISHNGAWYWFNQDGHMQTGLVEANGKRYMLDDSGAMQTGWLYQQNHWLYATESGSLVISDWAAVNNKWYLFDANGQMLTGKQQVSGSWYLLDETGAMQTGWLYIQDHWYYAKENGALAASEWISHNGAWYWFNQDGHMQTGLVEANGKRYMLDDSGAMQTGWLYQQNHWLYATESGSLVISDWAAVNNKWYLFDANGQMLTGKQQVSGSWYLLDETGAMQTGWLYYQQGWYHASSSGAFDQGWFTDGDGRRYFLDPKKQGCAVTGEATVDGFARVFNPSSCALVTNGTYNKNHIDWLTDSEGRIVFCVKTNNQGQRYPVDAAGRLLNEGFVSAGGHRFYVGPDHLFHTGVLNIQGKRYHFNDQGHLNDGWAQESDGRWYYCNNDGEQLTGWGKIDGAWYFFDAEGMMQTGWINEGGKRYFLNNSGAMQTGWIYQDNLWYLLNGSGALTDTATPRQKAVVDACHRTAFQGTGWCGQWVRVAINNAGIGNFYDGYTAAITYHRRCYFSNKKDLKVGMIIATPHAPYAAYYNDGHIGIYLGNNQVAHNASSVRIDDLDEWIYKYTSGNSWSVGWGWLGGVDLSQ